MQDKKSLTPLFAFAFIVASYLSGCTSTEDSLPPTAWSKFDFVVVRKYKPAEYPTEILRCYYIVPKENVEEIAHTGTITKRSVV